MKPAETPAASPRPPQAGFTLLEVLAAVAILGIWYMVMASIATQGLRAEGESQRRLRASLLADEILADLESGLVLGSAPAAQTEETVRDRFTVRVVVEPYLLEFPGPPDIANPEGKPEPALQKLVGPSGESLLSQIEVEVSWIEGSTAQRVWRESFGLDLVPVLAALAELSPEATATDDGEAESDDEGLDPTKPTSGTLETETGA